MKIEKNVKNAKRHGKKDMEDQDKHRGCRLSDLKLIISIFFSLWFLCKILMIFDLEIL
jgi:hypothetical protein